MGEHTICEVAALQGHADKVWAVAFAPDGSLLASGGEDRAIILWDVETRRRCYSYRGHCCGVNSVVFSPRSNLLASGGEEGTVQLLHLEGGGGWIRRGHHGGVNQVVFSPGGRLLASAGGCYGQAGQVKIWDTAGGRERASLIGHTDEVMTVAFSPTGRYLLTGDFSGTLRLWDVTSGELRLCIDAHLGAIWKVAFVYDDHVLLSAGEDGKLRAWLAPEGRQLSEFPGNSFGLLSFALANNGQVAVGGFDGDLTLWNLQGKLRVQHLGNHGAAVFSVAFAPDNQLIASAGVDHVIRLWEIRATSTRRRTATLQPAAHPEAPALAEV